MTMMHGFREVRIATGEAALAVWIGGEGPPLVCVHGYPQSHLTWRKIAPMLAERYTVVLPDLRGYGASEIVASDDAHFAYSKRAMARDIIAIMTQLGYERFFLAGHDRGGRVAYRLALDAPERVAALVTLDIIPTLENWEAMDYRSAITQYHWPFLAQPEPVPERLIGSDPRWYCRQQIQSWLEDADAIDDAILDAYSEAFARPGAVHAACEDYRAGATCDMAYDRAYRDAGRRITVPMFALYGAGHDGTRSAHFPAVWRRWATDLRTLDIRSGHFMMEEKAAETGAALRDFFDLHHGRLSG
jgi:haloacetate dehalogenase